MRAFRTEFAVRAPTLALPRKRERERSLVGGRFFIACESDAGAIGW